MTSQKEGNVLFPIFLKLRKITTLIVGGGVVGLEKTEALLKNDPQAQIRLVAPDICEELLKLSQDYNIRIHQRKYQAVDLDGAGLVILATSARSLHKEILEKAHQQNLLVNVADTPDLCDFYLGSTVKKGDLKIGISTNGQSPTLAKRFREILEDILPDETQSLLDNLRQIRDSLQVNFTQKVKKLNEITSVMRPDQ